MGWYREASSKQPHPLSREAELLHNAASSVRETTIRLARAIETYLDDVWYAQHNDALSATVRDDYYSTLPGMSGFLAARNAAHAPKPMPRPPEAFAESVDHWQGDVDQCLRRIRLMRVGFNDNYLDEPEEALSAVKTALLSAQADDNQQQSIVLSSAITQLQRCALMMQDHIEMVSGVYSQAPGGDETRPSFKHLKNQ